MFNKRKKNKKRKTNNQFTPIAYILIFLLYKFYSHILESVAKIDNPSTDRDYCYICLYRVRLKM